MTKKYILNGLDCPNCAAKIESSVQTLEGVTYASVNLMASTLSVEVGDVHSEGVTSLIEGIVRSHEPEVVVTEHAAERSAHAPDHSRGGEEGALRLPLIIAGAAVFVAGLLLDNVFGIGGYLPLAVYLLGYLVLGGGIVLRALRNIMRGDFFDENFLMSVASIGAFVIGDYPEAVAVMLFYQVGEFCQALAVRKSKKTIADLMDIRPDYANLKRDGDIVRVAPEDVRIGDIIVVRPGEKIPLDGVITEGRSTLDTAALTGESAPRDAAPGDAVLSGCVNQSGLLAVKVTTLYGQSTAARILGLVEDAAGRKARTEQFITKFSRYYTPAVVGLAALIAVLPPLVAGGGWADWLGRGLIFLVISCPCALVVSIPLSFFGGIGAASKRGVLVKGGNYLEALGNLDVVVFDKTGTLTKGAFEVTAVRPAQGFTREALLALAAHAEAYSGHPVALSILKAYGAEVDKDRLADYRELPGRGVSVMVDGKAVLAGNGALMDMTDTRYEPSQDIGTKVYVAEDGVYAGCITVADAVKPDSLAAIGALRARGVRKTVMLTGDDERIAQTVGAQLGIDEVYGGLLPGQKVERVEALCAQKRSNGHLAFVGDGINDAPALVRADIGVAMGGLGSDAAIEAADVVLMTDEPGKLAEAVDVARATGRIVRQNICFALGFKAIFLLLGALGMATMWEAVFADVGVALLAVLNASRIMRRQ